MSWKEEEELEQKLQKKREKKKYRAVYRRAHKRRQRNYRFPYQTASFTGILSVTSPRKTLERIWREQRGGEK